MINRVVTFVEASDLNLTHFNGRIRDDYRICNRTTPL